MKNTIGLMVLLLMTIVAKAQSQQTQTVRYKAYQPGEKWYDDRGEMINAHGGGILYSDGTYYWFGERRGRRGSRGVNVYSSKDLYNWKLEALALAQETDTLSEITVGSVMERPKVIYNAKTRQYVMWFHLELRGQGYRAARAGVAVSDKVTGPYRYVHSFRPNGNMSRDMGLFVDDDGAAYHIYSSRENYDLRLSKLTDDYLRPTQLDTMLFSQHREAPAIFKHNKKYYLITSGCTGWKPNAASMHVSSSLWGPWQPVGSPLTGPGADTTYGAQSTFVLPVPGKPGAFIFMADKWNPNNLEDSRYIWLPVQFNHPQPRIDWVDTWDLSVFNK